MLALIFSFGDGGLFLAFQRAHLVELTAAASLKGVLALARIVLSGSGLSAKNSRTSLSPFFFGRVLGQPG
ncbi:MAG: hypothetical protein LBI10_02685 [Deltaproteobacteria bacterium]|nr:hypothetical protein [Deltaproteobacteria bacterium]